MPDCLCALTLFDHGELGLCTRLWSSGEPANREQCTPLTPSEALGFHVLQEDLARRVPVEYVTLGPGVHVRVFPG